MVKARKYVVAKRFQGIPKRDDYKIVEEELPPLKDGEILVKTEYISVDPYLRAYHNSLSPPYDQFSYQVARIIESKDPSAPVGSRVVSHAGWRDHTVFNLSEGTVDAMSIKPYLLPEAAKDLSPSYAIGVIGMPGATAYFGFLDICKPKPGETVAVTGAAGAVGSLVGQIAKIKGCRVIGFAGSDKKVDILKEQYGFDHAFNYKTTDIRKALKEAAPNGVDCYFDNVGGEISSIIIGQMNTRGRISVCGSISVYNEDLTNAPKASVVQPSLVFKELTMEGFLIWRWREKQPEAWNQLAAWLKEGKLKAFEHVTEGFDKLYDAFIGMLQGDNVGKAVVKV